MTTEVVRARDSDDVDRVLAIDAAAFHMQLDEAILDRARGHAYLEQDRAYVAIEDGQVVGASANLALELGVPGGAVLPLSGVTYVSVLPTHRRRGHLTRMMARLHEDGRERGEPLAGLFASESLIYGRFGYGVAAHWGTVRLARDRATLRVLRPRQGWVELVDLETALTAFEGIHAAVAHDNGMLSRPPRMVRTIWAGWLAHAGGRARQLALHRDPSGTPDGLLLYEVEVVEAEGDWVLKATVHVRELWAANPAAELELWRFALDLDLTTDVQAGHQRPDHAVRDLLADPRHWRSSTIDALHLCIQDVDRCLGARRYQADDVLHIEVVRPDGATSCHRLEGGPHGATCEPYRGSPDLTLDLTSLGSIYLGDTAVERLWRAGLVTEHHPGVIRRATTMFSWAPRPWPGYVF